MPTRTRILDLSVPTEPSDSEPLRMSVHHESHRESAPIMAQFFGCTTAHLPDGLGWANEHVELIGHSGTHVDAPWHYFPISEGKPARTIDQCPLEWFYADGVVLDVRHLERGAVIEVDDLKAALARIDYRLKPFDIVMLHTGTDKLWGKAEYFEAGSGLNRESTIWLCDQGIKVIAHVSRDETLYPGDFLGSGTVTTGAGLELDRWITPGVTVELEVERLGMLRNRVVRPA